MHFGLQHGQAQCALLFKRGLCAFLEIDNLVALLEAGEAAFDVVELVANDLDAAVNEDGCTLGYAVLPVDDVLFIDVEQDVEEVLRAFLLVSWKVRTMSELSLSISPQESLLRYISVAVKTGSRDTVTVVGSKPSRFIFRVRYTLPAGVAIRWP